VIPACLVVAAATWDRYPGTAALALLVAGVTAGIRRLVHR